MKEVIMGDAIPLGTLVMKFGGTSVGGTEAFEQVREIVSQARKDWPRLVVITSAMAGVTNLLLEGATGAIEGNGELTHQIAARIRSQHLAVVEALLPDLARQSQLKQEISHLVSEFTNLCQAITVLGEATPRALDAVTSLGERLSVRLLAAVLEAGGIASQWVEATQLIITDRQFQAAHPDFPHTEQATRQVLEPILAQGRVAVVTGYIAATQDGVTTTLGRGGSDYTAGILGAVLPANDVWIWTDVDGVMTADPRLVPEARTIPVLSYREIAELAYFGAKVVHPKTIRPVIEANIGLRVCNTFNPSHPGTRVVSDPTNGNNGEEIHVKAVTAIRGQSLITVEGKGMLGVPGVAARTFGAVAATGTSVPLITQASSEQSICFAVPIETVGRVIASLESAFELELRRGDIDRVWATGEVTIITIVGAGMRSTPGIAGRIFTALGRREVNVIAIAQGSSEVSVSLVVDAKDANEGVSAVHELIVDRIGRP
jgi:aspartokinase/homoserine dehydrogenase 1